MSIVSSLVNNLSWRGELVSFVFTPLPNPFFLLPQALLMEWRTILFDIGVPFRRDLSLKQYLSTAKQRLEWQVKMFVSLPRRYKNDL